MEQEQQNNRPLEPGGPTSAAGSEPFNDTLWHIARKRAAFKKQLLVYVLVTGVMVAIWWFTAGPGTYFWPIWSAMGWGLGLAYQYVKAYHDPLSAEKEYEKLKRQQ